MKITTTLATLLVGAAALAPTAVVVLPPAAAEPTTTVDAPDLNGTLQEDDPGWDCRTGGDRICGPLSDDAGHTPGCYDDIGTLVALWPCYVVTNADGSADVYTPQEA